MQVPYDVQQKSPPLPTGFGRPLLHMGGAPPNGAVLRPYVQQQQPQVRFDTVGGSAGFSRDSSHTTPVISPTRTPLMSPRVPQPMSYAHARPLVVPAASNAMGVGQPQRAARVGETPIFVQFSPGRNAGSGPAPLSAASPSRSPTLSPVTTSRNPGGSMILPPPVGSGAGGSLNLRPAGSVSLALGPAVRVLPVSQPLAQHHSRPSSPPAVPLRQAAPQTASAPVLSSVSAGSSARASPGLLSSKSSIAPSAEAQRGAVLLLPRETAPADQGQVHEEEHEEEAPTIITIDSISAVEHKVSVGTVGIPEHVEDSSNSCTDQMDAASTDDTKEELSLDESLDQDVREAVRRVGKSISRPDAMEGVAAKLTANKLTTASSVIGLDQWVVVHELGIPLRFFLLLREELGYVPPEAEPKCGDSESGAATNGSGTPSRQQTKETSASGSPRRQLNRMPISGRLVVATAGVGSDSTVTAPVGTLRRSESASGRAMELHLLRARRAREKREYQQGASERLFQKMQRKDSPPPSKLGPSEAQVRREALTPHDRQAVVQSSERRQWVSHPESERPRSTAASDTSHSAQGTPRLVPRVPPLSRRTSASATSSAQATPLQTPRMIGSPRLPLGETPVCGMKGVKLPGNVLSKFAIRRPDIRRQRPGLLADSAPAQTRRSSTSSQWLEDRAADFDVDVDVAARVIDSALLQSDSISKTGTVFEEALPSPSTPQLADAYGPPLNLELDGSPDSLDMSDLPDNLKGAARALREQAKQVSEQFRSMRLQSLG
eukprot:TRINITY_DN90632_c0_g1_i1.p1 TRINITY_DN90632_c0_g1~~TRINITY_DN90632_c0_g1_i1.p1  ORF type:complete len:776 (+),score=109.47 TRINITY_DN90632_c0_g1_i1:74-2401(+)